MTAAQIRKEQADFMDSGNKLSSTDLLNSLSLRVIASMAIEIAAQLAEHNERENRKRGL